MKERYEMATGRKKMRGEDKKGLGEEKERRTEGEDTQRIKVKI